MLRSIVDEKSVLPLSNITPRTLISGLPKSANNGRETSLLAHIDGMLLIIKDLTPLISGPRDALHLVLGQLRDAYDGSSAMAFGTGETKSFETRFGLLFGVTSVIESSWPVVNQLGERFLYYRLEEGGGLAKVKAALANANSKDKMRLEIQNAVTSLLKQKVPRREVLVSPEMQQEIAHAAELIARARTPIRREGRTEELIYLPNPEVGTRLAGQFIQLARGIALARGESSCDASIMKIIRHVARSGLPHMRLQILRELSEQKVPISTGALGQALRLGVDSVRRHGEDLWQLKLLDRVGNGPHTWALSKLARTRLKTSKLFSDVTPP